MKKLYYQQLQELSGQFICHVVIGYIGTYPILGNMTKASTHHWFMRFPIAVSLAMFLGVQAQYWNRPNKIFHELMA